MAGRYFIGIDLGGTNLKAALIDRKYRILDKRVLSTRGFCGRDALISGIAAAVNGMILDRRLNPKEIIGLGIGLPGPVNSEQGLVHFLPNIPGWKEVPLRAILSRKLKLPVFLDNDANLMALAEHKLGAARGAKNALCLTLGTGVGGGLIIEGSLLRGATFSAGEIGHLPISISGPKCNCGGRGCLERYIGNERIKEAAAKVFKRHISLEELSALAKKRDIRAAKIWEQAGEHLGIALAAAINLIDLDVVVVGGGVANAGEALFTSVRKTVKNRAMDLQARHVKIKKALLGDNGGVIGAAILVAEGKADVDPALPHSFI